jgi:hypothetical protein
MAYEGMDAPAVTHIAALTYYRSKPWIEQMIARACRKYLNKTRAYVFCPDDPKLAEIIDQIRKEQMQAAKEMGEEEGPGTTGVGDGSSPTDYAEVVPCGSQSTTSRISALDEDVTLTSRQFAWLAREGFNPTSYPDVILAYRKCGQVIPEADVQDASLPLRDYEQALRTAIQNRCNQIDATRRSAKFGATNTELKNHFGKSREVMGQKELRSAWAYLNQKYPMRMS